MQQRNHNSIGLPENQERKNEIMIILYNLYSQIVIQISWQTQTKKNLHRGKIREGREEKRKGMKEKRERGKEGKRKKG